MKKIIYMLISVFCLVLKTHAIESDALYALKLSISIGGIAGYTYVAMNESASQKLLKNLHSKVPGIYKQDLSNKLPEHYYANELTAWCLTATPIVLLTILAIGN